MKTKLISILIIALSVVIILPGCKIEGCTDKEAWNFDPDATSDDGSCVTFGIINGIWNADELCDGIYDYDYTVTVTTTGTSITIVNFGGFVNEITATGTSSNGNITIPSQTHNNVTISGSGNYYPNGFELTYTASSGGQSTTCTATFTQ